MNLQDYMKMELGEVEQICSNTEVVRVMFGWLLITYNDDCQPVCSQYIPMQ